MRRTRIWTDEKRGCQCEQKQTLSLVRNSMWVIETSSRGRGCWAAEMNSLPQGVFCQPRASHGGPAAAGGPLGVGTLLPGLSALGSSARAAAVVLLWKVPQETPNAMLTTTELTWLLHSLLMSLDEDTAQRHLAGGLAKPSLPALAETCIPNLNICFSAPPTPQLRVKFPDRHTSVDTQVGLPSTCPHALL